MSQEGFKRKLTAILSADVEGYSRLMGEDEEATIRTLTTYRNAIAKLVQQYRGRVVDSPGDNILSEFTSAVDAVNCAVEIQRELAERRKSLLANTANLESARAKVRKLESDAKQQLERHEELKTQCDEAKAKLDATGQLLAAAKRTELELLAKEHAEKAAQGREGGSKHKKAICINLTTLLGEDDAPIDIDFGNLLDDFSDITLSPEEEREKEELEKSFGIAAGEAARKQFEPMLEYLRKQAALQ